MTNFKCLLLFFFASLTIAHAQKKITVDDFTIRNTFAEKEVSGINWMNDGQYYTTLSDNKVVKYDVRNGQAVQTLVDGNALSTPVVMDGYSFSADETNLLIQTQRQSVYRRSFVAEYFVYSLSDKSVRPLSSRGRQSYASFSPDGERVAFVRNNNLFYVTLSSMEEEQVTSDGQFNAVINGTTDWVYEEEFSIVVGFQWSPDAKKLAYYRFDESAVKEYNLQLWGDTLYPYDYRYKYPKAGEKNSAVEIWIYDLASRQKVKADLGTEADVYVPRITWTENAGVLSVRKLHRLQNQMQLLHVDASTGAAEIILDEKTDTYFDLEVLDVLYLRNGKEFVCTAEHDGYRHIYLYSIKGELIRQLTSGAFEVSDFFGCDEKNKVCYYASTEESPLERHLYSVTLDGRKKTKLSGEPGKHHIEMSRDYQFYMDHHRRASHPTIATLYRTRKNVPLKVLERNEALAAAVKDYGIVAKEFFSFKNGDGVELNGLILKPRSFDVSKEYPVMVFQYSGPGSQEVENAWAGGHFYFHQMLTQKGYIVAIVDPRGTGGRGERFKKVTYRQLGKYELEDHLEAARYLASLEFVDESRIGIWGWSYGGYMASLAMTKGAGVFKLGIAVAPVTNWRFYDTIYTERYLQTPQMNPKGYDMNSPLTHAEKLKGDFLLIHGTGDDNVHFQNSVVLANALINAGKRFQSFFYPDKQHAIEGAKTRHHLYTLMLEFIERNL